MYTILVAVGMPRSLYADNAVGTLALARRRRLAGGALIGGGLIALAAAGDILR